MSEYLRFPFLDGATIDKGDATCLLVMLCPTTTVQGVSVWEGAEEVQSIIHIKAEKCKNMKHSQDMQLIQKLRDDQKCMKKVFEVMSGRNIVTNSRVTPSWREIVSLTFSEAGVLHVNWISFGHCVCGQVSGRGTLVPTRNLARVVPTLAPLGQACNPVMVGQPDAWGVLVSVSGLSWRSLRRWIL
ncbi:hypothetical protein Tco_0060899 [Tanacetum coccineum]